MLPAGVDTRTPSQISSPMRTMPSTRMRIFAAWRVWRSSETSLMASASCIVPRGRAHRKRWSLTGSAATRRSQIVAADTRSSGSRRCRGACRRSACRARKAVQRLQHESVAAQRHDDVGPVGVGIARTARAQLGSDEARRRFPATRRGGKCGVGRRCFSRRSAAMWRATAGGSCGAGR